MPLQPPRSHSTLGYRSRFEALTTARSAAAAQTRRLPCVGSGVDRLLGVRPFRAYFTMMVPVMNGWMEQ
jgi:hypothetical protein